MVISLNIYVFKYFPRVCYSFYKCTIIQCNANLTQNIAVTSLNNIYIYICRILNTYNPCCSSRFFSPLSCHKVFLGVFSYMLSSVSCVGMVLCRLFHMCFRRNKIIVKHCKNYNILYISKIQ